MVQVQRTRTEWSFKRDDSTVCKSNLMMQVELPEIWGEVADCPSYQTQQGYGTKGCKIAGASSADLSPNELCKPVLSPELLNMVAKQCMRAGDT